VRRAARIRAGPTAEVGNMVFAAPKVDDWQVVRAVREQPSFSSTSLGINGQICLPIRWRQGGGHRENHHLRRAVPFASSAAPASAGILQHNNLCGRS